MKLLHSLLIVFGAETYSRIVAYHEPILPAPSEIETPAFLVSHNARRDNEVSNPLAVRDTDRSKCNLDTYETLFATPLHPESPSDSEWINITASEPWKVDTMTLPGDSMYRFYKTEEDFTGVAGYRPIVTQPGGQDECTSSVRVLTTKPQSLGTRGLSGCTTMVLISRSGVYMGHFWESIAFSVDQDYIDLYGSSMASFQINVIDGIENGRTGQKSLAGFAYSLLKTGPVKGYLIVPSTSFDKTPAEYQDYQARWFQMRNAVGKIIPALADTDPNNMNQQWTIVTYAPLSSNSRLLKYSERGRVLFKYDPNHNGKKKAALWVEGSGDIHGDEW